MNQCLWFPVLQKFGAPQTSLLKQRKGVRAEYFEFIPSKILSLFVMRLGEARAPNGLWCIFVLN